MDVKSETEVVWRMLEPFRRPDGRWATGAIGDRADHDRPEAAHVEPGHRAYVAVKGCPTRDFAQLVHDVLKQKLPSRIARGKDSGGLRLRGVMVSAAPGEDGKAVVMESSPVRYADLQAEIVTPADDRGRPGIQNALTRAVLQAIDACVMEGYRKPATNVRPKGKAR